MTQIRFLTPFVFILACFFVSLAIVYYLSAEIDRVERETERLNDPPQTERDRRSAVFDDTFNLISDTIAVSDPVVENEMPSFGNEHVERLRELSQYLGMVDQRYRRIATVKAQQPVLLLGASPLPLNEQVNYARQELSELENALDAGVRRNVQPHITTIQEELSAVESFPEARRSTLEGMAQIARSFNLAAEAASNILDELSFEQEADRFQLVALTSSSKAARAASRLQMLLKSNSLEGMRRELDESLSFAEHEAQDVGMRALIADLQQADRSYNLDPSYAAGATIEDVVLHQDLLLDLLYQINESLTDQLAVTVAVRHRDFHEEFQQRALRAIETMQTRRETDLEGKRRIFDRLDSSSEDAIRRLRSARDDLELIQDGMDRPFRDAVFEAEVLINQMEQDLIRMRDEFIRLRTEGLPRPTTALTHADEDGQIVRLNEASRYYHIDLGRADNIRRGTRFMVMGDRDGERYAKAMLEVVNIMNENYSQCRVIQRFDDEVDIFEGDPVYNRFFHNGGFLSVALVGEFRADVSPFSEERLIRFLEEIGCNVQEEADVNTDLVILAEPRDELMPVLPEIRRYLELTDLITLDEELVTDLLPYFQDR